VRSFEVTNAPVRCAKFVARKQWIIVGADDTKIRVYNYNTSEKLKVVDEHTDFIRYLAVHPTLPYIISCSDDQTIKLFDWDKNWQKINSYEDHEHYIMQVAINPKDPSMFASASLDRTIKIWTISASGKGGAGKSSANYSLIGHQAGVNCIDFCSSFDRPHLVSGGDDGHVKVWDYQTK
jgi:coatomer subunit beta'